MPQSPFTSLILYSPIPFLGRRRVRQRHSDSDGSGGGGRRQAAGAKLGGGRRQAAAVGCRQLSRRRQRQAQRAGGREDRERAREQRGRVGADRRAGRQCGQEAAQAAGRIACLLCFDFVFECSACVMLDGYLLAGAHRHMRHVCTHTGVIRSTEKVLSRRDIPYVCDV